MKLTSEVNRGHLKSPKVIIIDIFLFYLKGRKYDCDTGTVGFMGWWVFNEGGYVLIVKIIKTLNTQFHFQRVYLASCAT